ncbi:Response regulator protein GraR [bioreactor metagenome]|uniref:Response regulator protein GraR n=1 Tax=bioreactor metagenome TaxID=1076179 RepID=A0A644XTP1_9ZZZZ
MVILPPQAHGYDGEGEGGEERNLNGCHILIVEDDPVIAGAMEAHLQSWGYRVTRVGNFQNVMEEFAAAAPQLVLLDVSLPFFNGYHWCTEIRRVSQVPILFISSAGDDMNQIMAMNMGGDDFLAKPFDLNVLSAKVQALLRRAYDFSGPAQLLPCGGAVLNVSDGTLTAGAEKLELTRNELKILQMLLENRGRIVSRESLMTRLWESDAFVDENTLTVNVTRLRKKLAAAGLESLIRTKKGAGYLVEG